MVAGVAGLVAGAMSMAAGEYVSVSSQADTENADLDRERKELATDGEFEHSELAAIYVKRGLDESLAQQVAEQLMAHDAIGAHARDELGISETMSARPVQAAMASAATFAVGAALPLGSCVSFARKDDPDHRLDYIAGFSCVAGWCFRPCRWRSRRKSGGSRYLLGDACDGGNRGDRRAIRSGGIMRKVHSAVIPKNGIGVNSWNWGQLLELGSTPGIGVNS